ncbi:MAG: hypothetical protein IJ499_05985 [Clostridia bacterium]|nr:hypothetical protein [Clostridia bacterium]
MKDKICFKKYKNNIIIFGILSVISLFLCAANNFAGCVALAAFGSVTFYNTYSYFTYKKKSKNIIPSVGVISTWSYSGYPVRCGGVIIKLDGKEYCSPNYFSTHEAETMVGKMVHYVIIDETLLVYDIIH